MGTLTLVLAILEGVVMILGKAGEAAVGFDPSSVTRPVLEAKLHSQRKRGWGLELIRRLMDDVTITSRPGLTKVHMIRRTGGE